MACSWLALLVGLFGCPATPPSGPGARARVRVRSFTEATPVHHILAVPPFAFAATSAGLDRWDLRSGQASHLGAEDGLSGERVQALAHDFLRGELWIATEVGVVRYDVREAAFHEVSPPPDILGVDSFEGASVAAAREGGAWIGLARGLFRVTREGDWAPTGVTSPVTALHVAPDGDLWIGTSVGLFVSMDGVAAPFGPERGCELAAVRFVSPGPDGRAVVVGENALGQQRIALASGAGCHSYRVSPDVSWVAAAGRAGELLILTEGRLYSLRRPSDVGGRVLVRDGMQLLPVPRADGTRPAASPFVMRPMSGHVPAGAQALAAFDGEVLVGTRSLGTARVTGGRAVQWLRRGELVDQASSLSVACTTRDDCYVATGSRRAWRFDGERFAPSGGGDRRVLAVVRAPDGGVLGVRQTADGGDIALAEVRGGEWTDLGITIDVPGRDPELSTARFSPSGLLWLGLRYRDDSGELRPHGVALVDVPLGLVVYHHASDDEREADRGILPIPIGVAAVAFQGDDEAWLATSQGVARVKGQEVEVFSEADGLRSEILRAVACGRDGLVYAGGGDGVGVFEGGRWTYSRALSMPVNDLEIAADGRLWMATDRGLAVYDGARVGRLDARRGLVEDRIQDIAIDQFGRVWLRGAASLGLVTP